MKRPPVISGPLPRPIIIAVVTAIALCAAFGLSQLWLALASSSVLMSAAALPTLLFCIVLQIAVAVLLWRSNRARAPKLTQLSAIIVALIIGAMQSGLAVMVVGTISALMIGDVVRYAPPFMSNQRSLSSR